jgi:toxin ParE1/3/4
MRHFRISSAATRDLEDIAGFISLNSRRAADRMIDRITGAFRRIAEMPGIGRQREEFSPGLRSFTVAPFLIFYRESEDGVEIVRVVHGARNLDDLFS